eukprot:2051251-Pleurochrysis_carterae.AAC.1
MAAAAARLWCDLNNQSNLWMCKPHKKSVGTVVDWIGGRYVLNAGFGCLTDAKRQRGILACASALDNATERSAYERDLGFLGHARAILGLPTSALDGAYTPLERGGPPWAAVFLTADARARLNDLLAVLRARACAWFACAVDDAALILTKNPPPLNMRMASDAYIDSSGGAIFGACAGDWWLFLLAGDWLCRHITFLESVGPCVNIIMFGAPLARANVDIVLDGDSTAAGAMLTWRAKARDLQRLNRRLELEPAYQAVQTRLWVEH